MTVQTAGIVMGLVAIDQLSKAMALSRLPVMRNTGISFGIWRSIDLWIILIVLGFLIAISVRERHPFRMFLVIAGGASNVIDRVLRGAVIDWIPGMVFHFNLADVMITTGVIWIFLSSMRTKTRSL